MRANRAIVAAIVRVMGGRARRRPVIMPAKRDMGAQQRAERAKRAHRLRGFDDRPVKGRRGELQPDDESGDPGQNDRMSASAPRANRSAPSPLRSMDPVRHLRFLFGVAQRLRRSRRFVKVCRRRSKAFAAAANASFAEPISTSISS
jgi:hypothetical protein